MAHIPAEPPPGLARLSWGLSIFTAIASLLLSLIASCLTSEGSCVGFGLNALAKLGEALYQSAEILLLHLPHKLLPPHDQSAAAHVLFQIARPLAVIAMSLTGVSLVIQFFGRTLWRSWTAKRGNHVVICGLSRAGQWLVEGFRHAGDRVLVIDEGVDRAAVANAMEAGACILFGNPQEQTTLRQAGIQRARYLYMAMDDAGANVGAALHAIDIMQDQPRRRVPAPYILVHIADPPLRASLRRHRAFSADQRRPRVSMFNIYEDNARLLLLNEYLDYVRIDEHDERVVQIVVLGFGRMGEEVLTRAAMVGHYANLKWLRAIVIDRQALQKERLFRAHYSQFGSVCDAQFLPLDTEDPTTHARIAACCADATQTLSTVVICLSQETRALSLALSLSDHLGPNVPIRLRLREQSGLAALLQESRAGGSLPRQITAFGLLHEARSRKNWGYEDLDNMARALHADYVRNRREQHPASADDRSMRDWDQLDDDLIDSNRQLADHIPVKLRAIGYHIARRGSNDPGRLVREFSDAQIELLAKMEHQRWMAERFLAGWQRGPRDLEKRCSPHLVAWEDVPPEIQEYDRNFARILPEVLELAGCEIRQ
jgi:voltage-gated potassium channel Kch